MKSSNANDRDEVATTGNGFPDSWTKQKQIALQFESVDDLDAAIDWLWTTPDKAVMPRVHVGKNTMIVPASTVDHFKRQGFRFTVGQVISAGDLPSEEVDRVRRYAGSANE